MKLVATVLMLSLLVVNILNKATRRLEFLEMVTVYGYETVSSQNEVLGIKDLMNLGRLIKFTPGKFRPKVNPFQGSVQELNEEKTSENEHWQMNTRNIVVFVLASLVVVAFAVLIVYTICVSLVYLSKAALTLLTSGLVVVLALILLFLLLNFN